MRSILFYLLLTFFLTYLSHGLLAFLTSRAILDFSSLYGQFLFILGGSSPTIFAIVFILRNADKETKNRFIKKIFSFRHQPMFWVFALTTPLLLGGIFQLLYMSIAKETFSSSVPYYAYFIVFIGSILFGGLEEIGWRGFLQDKLMPFIPLIPLSIIIGLIWGLWHIPLFFIEEVSHNQFDFLPFLLGAVMFSTFLTWLYAVTKSILLVVLFHASINASATIGLRLVFVNSLVTYCLILLFTICGLLLLYSTQKKSLV